jgi:hypothetical protein
MRERLPFGRSSASHKRAILAGRVVTLVWRRDHLAVAAGMAAAAAWRAFMA